MGVLLIPRLSLSDSLLRWLLKRSGILARVSLSDIIIIQSGFAPVRARNRLFNQGELLVVRDIWRAEVVLPATFFGRLYNDTPADADLLTDLVGEPVGNGYAALGWIRGTTDFGVAAAVSGQAQTIGLKKDFTGTGAGYGPVTAFVFATTSDNTGVPFAWFPLSQGRTITPTAPLGIQPFGIVRGVSN